MPVPTLISELSQTAGSNSPPGTESPTTADDYLRTYAGFIATLRDGKGFSDPVQLASGATTDIGGQNSLFVEITGTTTITSLGTTYEGPRFLRFTGALILTHNATTLNLPGAANITTAAGDTAVAMPNYAGNGWNVVQFQRADGTALGAALASSSDVQTGTNATKAVTPSSLRGGAIVSATAQATTSGTAIDFTSIPSWVKRVTVMFDGVSLSGSAEILVQIGDSGGVEATGYSAAGTRVTVSAVSAAASTAGFPIRTADTTYTVSGSVELTLMDAATNKWSCQGVLAGSATVFSYVVAGTKALSAALDRVRIASSNGTDTFDAGSVNIAYE